MQLNTCKFVTVSGTNLHHFRFFFLKGEIHRANVTVFSVPGLCMDSLELTTTKKEPQLSTLTRQILIKSIQKSSQRFSTPLLFSVRVSESVFRMKTPLALTLVVWCCCCLTQLNYHLNTAVPIKVHYIRTITDCSNTHNCSIIFIFATIRKEISPGCKQEPQCNNPFIKPLFQLKHIHARCPILHQILFKIFDNSLYIIIQERS